MIEKEPIDPELYPEDAERQHQINMCPFFGVIEVASTIAGRVNETIDMVKKFPKNTAEKIIDFVAKKYGDIHSKL